MANIGQKNRLLVAGAMPGTLGHIQSATGISKSSTLRWVKFLKDCGEAHISGWVPTAGKGGPIQAIYHPGPGADVVSPLHGLTKCECDELSRARRELAARNRRAAQLARTGTTSQNIVIRRDPLTAAFFGEA